MKPPNAADALAAVLAGAGVEVVFGIPSIHNLPIYDALRRAGATRVVTVRHEQAAAGAADAYARVSGRLGVCLSSTGPGAANAMAAQLEALVSSSPVLHVTGQVDSRYLGQARGYIHEVPDQSGMLRTASKWHRLVTSPAEVPASVAEALAEALTPRQGPVALEIPIDVQSAPCEPPLVAQLLDARAPEPPSPADAAAVERAVAILAAAERPLVWAGGGVVASGATEALGRLAALLGAGVMTTPNGRGTVAEDDPMCLGNLSWEPSVRRLCREADVLLAVGTRFQGPNTLNWKMQLPPTIVQIDVDPSVPGRSYPVTCSLVGDARASLEQILAALSEAPGWQVGGRQVGGRQVGERVLGGKEDWKSRVKQAALEARSSLRATLGAHEGLFDAMAASIGPRTVVVKDSTIPAYTWGNRLLPVSRPRRSVMSNSFAIGLGLPHAIGAACATEEGDGPVLLLVGDGGFMLSAAELATCAAEGLAVVAVVFDDGGYGILRNIQDHRYRARLGVDLPSADFCALARSLGVAAERVSSAEELASAASAAMAKPEPRLVHVDLSAIGPMAQPYLGTSAAPD